MILLFKKKKAMILTQREMIHDGQQKYLLVKLNGYFLITWKGLYPEIIWKIYDILWSMNAP